MTWGVGNMPFAPGTWGSLPPFVLAFLSFFFLGKLGYFVVAGLIIVLFFTGIIACNRYMAITGREDPKEVVVDEVVGQLIVLLAAAPIIGARDHGGIEGQAMLFACFVLFRFFDILKPWPVSWADQKVEGGLGVMLDDVLAGIYGAIVFYVGAWVLGYIGV
jgi:phosphatidylglycerophosphatase A